jgi:methylphosphotriester-DNA--protein-cysteine methyltransferase
MIPAGWCSWLAILRSNVRNQLPYSGIWWYVSDMTMPIWTIPLEAPPEIVDFGFGRLPRHARRTYLFPDLWTLHLYRYRCTLWCDQERMEVVPRMVGMVAPGVRITYALPYEPAFHIYAIIRLAGQGSAPRVPALLNLGAEFARAWDEMAGAIAARPLAPASARAGLWALLWRCAERADLPDEAAHPPVVRRTLARIASASDGQPRVSFLARAEGVAPDSLSRLFRVHLGLGLMAYLRQRRRERIERLLTTSDLACAEIAAEVGCADLQQFNKLVRKLCGRPPSALRAAVAGEGALSRPPARPPSSRPRRGRSNPHR